MGRGGLVFAILNYWTGTSQRTHPLEVPPQSLGTSKLTAAQHCSLQTVYYDHNQLQNLQTIGRVFTNFLVVSSTDSLQQTLSQHSFTVRWREQRNKRTLSKDTMRLTRITTITTASITLYWSIASLWITAAQTALCFYANSFNSCTHSRGDFTHCIKHFHFPG